MCTDPPRRCAFCTLRPAWKRRPARKRLSRWLHPTRLEDVRWLLVSGAASRALATAAATLATLATTAAAAAAMAAAHVTSTPLLPLLPLCACHPAHAV